MSKIEWRFQSPLFCSPWKLINVLENCKHIGDTYNYICNKDASKLEYILDIYKETDLEDSWTWNISLILQ